MKLCSAIGGGIFLPYVTETEAAFFGMVRLIVYSIFRIEHLIAMINSVFAYVCEPDQLCPRDTPELAFS